MNGWPEMVDVLVVGGRCAGAGTALQLTRGGLSVLAVDRARYGSDTLSTHALARPGVLALSRWGVLDDVRVAGTPAVTRVSQHYRDADVEIPIRRRGDVDGLYAPRRHVLDRILVDAAIRAGADVRHQVTVRDLLVEGARVVGAVLDDGQQHVPVRARLIVGADGARSAVARRVGARIRYAAPHATATIYTYVGGLPAEAYHNYFRRDVGAGLIPTNGGQAVVWVGAPTGRIPSGRDGRARLFTETLAAAAPELARAIGPGAGNRYATFTGAPSVLRRCWGPGWALVGDAAYYSDPVSAHGMTDALLGAESLARAVLAAAAGEAESVAMAAYCRQRDRLTALMIPAIEHLASFRWDEASVRRAHQAINAAMHAEVEYLEQSAA